MDPKTQRLLLLSARISVAVILIVFLIRLARVEEILNSLSRIRWPSLSLAILFLYASILLGSFNQYFLFQPILRISFRKFIRSYFKAYIAGLFIPGQVGDASIIFFLRHSGPRYSQNFSIYLWDKYITLLLYAGVLFLFLSDLTGYSIFFIPVILTIFLGFSAGMLYSVSILGNYEYLEGWLGRISTSLKNITFEIAHYAGSYPLRLLINLSLTCIKILLVMSCYYFIFSALGYMVSLWKIGISSIASGIIAYLPISIQGIGTVEAAAVWIFGQLNISPADVLSGFLLLRACGYVLAIAVFSLIFLMKFEDNTKQRD
jgi:uncharacterized membrane protein YbhN (UPF0104 family)